MKNIFKKAILSAFVLSSCACTFVLDGNGNSSTSSNNEASSTVPTPSTQWGKEIDEYCFANFKTVLPYIESNSFESTTSKDDFGDPVLCLYCFYDSDEDATDAEFEYYSICEQAGYECESATNWGYDETTYEYYQYDTNFADKIVDTHMGLEIQFLTSTYKNKPTLGIFAYTYVYEDENVYPQVAVDHYLGNELGAKIPQLLGEGLMYGFTFDVDYYGQTYLKIIAIGDCVDFDFEEAYFNECLNAGFVMMDDSQEYILDEYPGPATYSYYYAIDPEQRFGFAFNYDYYDDYFDLEIFLA